MHDDRLFRVIVLGGIALAAGSGAVSACGGESSSIGDAGRQFPHEGASFLPPRDAAVDTGFPHEGPPPLPPPDSGGVDAAPDAFPHEGPAPLDAAPDATDAGHD